MKRFLAGLLIAGFVLPASAAPVTYTFSADIALDLGNDIYGLQGAQYTIEVSGDADTPRTSSIPSGSYGTMTEWDSSSLAAWDLAVTVTNRPGGLADHIVTYSLDGISVVNNVVRDGADQKDSFVVALTGNDSTGVVFPKISELILPIEEFAGLGAYPLPTLFNNIEMIDMGMVPFSDADRRVFYTLENEAFNVTSIPVPAAAWLFGSALGLIGWMRFRTTTKQ